MKPSVYIETSIVSALVDQRQDAVSRAQHLITTNWWRVQRKHFDLCYCEAVAAELRRTEFPNQAKALAALDEMRRMPITVDVEGAAIAYQKHLLMPTEDMGDAVHLAAACVYETNYLLTWNCKHLANVNKIRHLEVINRRLGLLTPVLLTPEMLIVEDAT